MSVDWFSSRLLPVKFAASAHHPALRYAPPLPEVPNSLHISPFAAPGPGFEPDLTPLHDHVEEVPDALEHSSNDWPYLMLGLLMIGMVVLAILIMQ